ncbi:PHD finger-like domain-containing protein 5B isoform X1 [Panicum miliaceum]|uniref:PHD finger-like domain-containing protein 5B isoform X1 n=1 Tax=Panicum miliaceum TaxID=4540 RepID=A0A3L6Q1Q9_PANMI|nr:PHD finger-like domain-containing protein 5B isoform X1 [Panicum miliaceum]
MVRSCTVARICDDCSYGAGGGGSGRERCMVCGVREGGAVADAYYCMACVRMEKERDGCPTVINAGTAARDSFYQRKKRGYSSTAARHSC